MIKYNDNMFILADGTDIEYNGHRLHFYEESDPWDDSKLKPVKDIFNHNNVKKLIELVESYGNDRVQVVDADYPIIIYFDDSIDEETFYNEILDNEEYEFRKHLESNGLKFY